MTDEARANRPLDSSFEDGFGRRTRALDPETGDEVELLELAPSLVEQDEFVTALSARVARVASVRHTSYVRLLRVDRPDADRIVLVSEHVPGWRLSELVRVASKNRVPIDTTVVIGILRQLLPAVALFGRNNRESAIATLAPERLILTPQARLVIAEHAFGPALDTLNLGRDRLWRDFRVAMPPSTGLPRADARADANAIGVVALSLLMGRALTDDEYPAKLQALVEIATELRDGRTAPLSRPLEQWLLRALQLDVRMAFPSTHDAQVGFEAVLAGDRGYVTTPEALEAFTTRVGGLVDSRQESSHASDAEQPARLLPVPARGVGVSESVPAPSPHVGADKRTAEPAPASAAGPAVRTAAGTRASLALTLAVLAILQSAVLVWLWSRGLTSPFSGTGDLSVQSRPSLARVKIDGEVRGKTPLTVRLPAGAHVLELEVGTLEPRVIPFTVQGGVQTAQYIEMQNVPTTGGIEVRSDPPGAEVILDGQRRGPAPFALADLPPGDYEIIVEGRGRTVKQPVHIEAGMTVQLLVSLPPP